MAGTSAGTRSTTIGPLIGQNRTDVPSGGLPTEEEVLQVIAPAHAPAPVKKLQGGAKEQEYK